VNAPFSWPNSSLSSSAAGIAAQLHLRNACARRALSRWTARATSSLPVPVSPQTRKTDVESRVAELEKSVKAIEAKFKAVSREVSRGVFAGVNLKGVVLKPEDELNAAVYNKTADELP
jgi:hypothetical protein